jgi:hypothetical protein
MMLSYRSYSTSGNLLNLLESFESTYMRPVGLEGAPALSVGKLIVSDPFCVGACKHI